MGERQNEVDSIFGITHSFQDFGFGDNSRPFIDFAAMENTSSIHNEHVASSPQPPPVSHPPIPITQNTKKQKWTDEEDKLLIESVKRNGTQNWPLIASALNGRTGKQCRERWLYQLNPALNKDEWTENEDNILIQNQRIYGNAWSKIATFLPGRSSNSVKNRWGYLSRHKNKSKRNYDGQQPPSAISTAVSPQISMIWGASSSLTPRATFSDPSIIHSFSRGTPDSDIGMAFPAVIPVEARSQTPLTTVVNQVPEVPVYSAENEFDMDFGQQQEDQDQTPDFWGFY